MFVYKLAVRVIISAHIPAILKLVEQLNSISYTNCIAKIEIIFTFFSICWNQKIHRTWQIYMLVGKSVGHHGCGNFWGCLGISLLYYCTIIIPLYQAMWLYKDVQYTIENIYILQVRFNRMIHNLTCILSEPTRQIL